MATINCVSTKCKSPSALKRIINYVTKTEKTNKTLISGKDLMPECAFQEMMLVKAEFNKKSGRQYLHMIQSFSPDEKLDYQTAHIIALKLAEHYEGHQVLVATHQDKKHIHSHLIINSVNQETGKKIQQSYKQLIGVMDISDSLCQEYGLSIIEKRNVGKRISKNEYHVAMKGDSWKMQLINEIDNAVDQTRTKDDFIHHMNAHGYDVLWQENRKYITYTTPDGKKCRCNKLHDQKYTKEEMDNVFNARQHEAEKSDKRKWSSVYKTADNNASTQGLANDDGYFDARSHTKDGRSQRRSRMPSSRYKRNDEQLYNADGTSNYVPNGNKFKTSRTDDGISREKHSGHIKNAGETRRDKLSGWSNDKNRYGYASNNDDWVDFYDDTYDEDVINKEDDQDIAEYYQDEGITR